jgi:hypothetical protein
MSHADQGFKDKITGTALRRFHAHHERINDERKLARILLETGEAAPVKVGHATAGGDQRKLRGIPAIGRGVTGAINGTVPHSTA